MKCCLRGILLILAHLCLVLPPVVAQTLINIAKPAAEPTGPSADKLFKLAKVVENPIFSLGLARTLKFMDATPDGSHWYVVDAFANWQTITIDGHVSEQFHEIPASGTRLSPNGDYLIWMGQMHAVAKYGYDSTTTYVFKDTTLIGNWVSDYPSLEFSASGHRWAALLPYAYESQKGDRDLVIVDGSIGHKGEVSPHQFSFSHDEQHWAYRATDGMLEKLVSDESDSAKLLYRRTVQRNGAIWDPTTWRYTPDVTFSRTMLEGRDYDFHFAHVAKLYKTAYSSLSADTARLYVNYNGKNHGLYRWINNILIDTSGSHIAYFAADPHTTRHTDTTDDRKAVVIYDGKIVAGPYPGVSSLFMSPSGKHIAYTLYRGCISCGHPELGKFYLDKKLEARTSQVLNCVWSPDETRIAMVVSGEHEKVFVASGKMRSPLFEQIGHVGWSADGHTIQFTGIRNGKLITVKLPV